MRIFGKLLLLFVGLGLFSWYISKVGTEQVWRAVLSLGPWAPLVLLPYVVVYNVDCLAWVQTLPAAARNIGYLTLLRIRWCGESINNLIPSGYVGGEALKVLLLRPHAISGAEGAASAVVSKSAQTLAQLVFILLASLLFLVLHPTNTAVRMGLLFLCFGGCVAVAGLFWIQSVGVFRMFVALLEKLPIKLRQFDAKKAKLIEFDATVNAFYKRNPRRFCRSTLLYFAGWVLDSIEIYLVAYLLHMPVSWSEAFIVEAFTGVAKVLGMWVPGSLGIQESGIVLTGRIAGLPDTLCAAYALIRRARELIFAGIGMLLLYMTPTAPKPSKLTAVTLQ